MKRVILFSTIILWTGICINAITLSDSMEKAIEACTGLSNAIQARTTSQLKAANKELKAANTVNFGSLRLHKGKELSVDGHFIFDEEFVDSLLVNRVVLNFSSHYAKKRSSKGVASGKGKIKMTTKALKAGENTIWKTSNSRNAEYALVAEPGGLFTMTIRDENGKVLHAETVNNKTGAAVRKAKFQLPDRATRIFIEVRNTGKKDASFALLGN